MAGKKKTSKSGEESRARRVRQSRSRSTTGSKPGKSSSRKKVTDRERIITMASLTRGEGKHKLYTMKEIADSLGISTRTLRRVKNVPGYNLAPRTFTRIHSDLVANYRKITPDLRKVYDIPKTTILPKPKEFKSKSGISRTLAFPTEGMGTDERIGFVEQLRESTKFKFWHFRVRVPVGVALSGRVDSDPKEVEINRGEDDAFYMSGPFLFSEESADEVQSHIELHEDAGREVVEVFVTEMFNTPTD